jgi:hypothetical protein
MRLSAAIVVFLAAITPGLAQSSHDGRWSVVVITEQGPCDVYRWEFDVSGGRVSPTRNATAPVTGGIGPRGAVNVTFRLGSDSFSDRRSVR